jgi:hypothetical protein
LILARGALYLDGVQFTSDPRTYDWQWPKRGSEHPTIGGGVTIQDFGRTVQDLVIHLADGGNYISAEVAVALDTKAATLGAAWSFQDWHGTVGTVFIRDFTLTETGLPGLYGYDMTLWVRSLSLLRGEPYTEA